MEIEGAVFTLDAMHCQKESAKAITEKKVDHILNVKGNQQKLAEAIGVGFGAYGESDNKIGGLRRHVTVDKAHGREERREYNCIAIDDEIFAEWSGAKTLGMIYRHREGNVFEHDETMFFISSLPPKVKRLSKLIREHWKIENSEHYVLDATFAEDSSRIRRETSPEISAAIRRMAMNILQRDTTVKDNIRGKRMQAGWDDAVLDGIYDGLNGDCPGHVAKERNFQSPAGKSKVRNLTDATTSLSTLGQSLLAARRQRIKFFRFRGITAQQTAFAKDPRVAGLSECIARRFRDFLWITKSSKSLLSPPLRR